MDLFGPPSWLAVHVGQFNLPERLDPLLDYGDGAAKSRAFVEQLAAAVARAAETMPTHADYIAHHCAG